MAKQRIVLSNRISATVRSRGNPQTKTDVKNTPQNPHKPRSTSPGQGSLNLGATILPKQQILLCMKFPKDSLDKLLRGTQVNFRKSLEKKLLQYNMIRDLLSPIEHKAWT